MRRGFMGPRSGINGWLGSSSLTASGGSKPTSATSRKLTSDGSLTKKAPRCAPRASLSRLSNMEAASSTVLSEAMVEVSPSRKLPFSRRPRRNQRIMSPSQATTVAQDTKNPASERRQGSSAVHEGEHTKRSRPRSEIVSGEVRFFDRRVRGGPWATRREGEGSPLDTPALSRTALLQASIPLLPSSTGSAAGACDRNHEAGHVLTSTSLGHMAILRNGPSSLRNWTKLTEVSQ